jgi:hypothetical protein
MTLPASGSITLGQVAAELGISLPLSLGDSRVRTLAGVPSGPISLGQLRGKSAAPPTPALSAYGQNASETIYTGSIQGGLATCTPSVTVSSGVPGYSYQWSFTSNPDGFAFNAGTTAASCSIAHSYSRGRAGTIAATLQCIVTDSMGQTVTVSNIIGSLVFESQ